MATPSTIEIWSIREPSEILSAALNYFALNAWTVTTQSREAAVFAREKAPEDPLLILLLLLGIVPGIIYLLIAKRTVTTSVTCRRAANGETSIYLTWSETEWGKPYCLSFAEMITEQEPELPPESEQREDTNPPSQARGRRRRRLHNREDSV